MRTRHEHNLLEAEAMVLRFQAQRERQRLREALAPTRCGAPPDKGKRPAWLARGASKTEHSSTGDAHKIGEQEQIVNGLVLDQEGGNARSL